MVTEGTQRDSLETGLLIPGSADKMNAIYKKRKDGGLLVLISRPETSIPKYHSDFSLLE